MREGGGGTLCAVLADFTPSLIPIMHHFQGSFIHKVAAALQAALHPFLSLVLHFNAVDSFKALHHIRN